MAPAITFAGIASGIDTNGLIDATSEAARATRVKPSEKKVTELEETNAAIDDLSSKFDSIRTILGSFNSLAGGGVSKTATSSKESSFTATATNAAANGSYSIEVTSVAKGGIYSFGPTSGAPAGQPATYTSPTQTLVTGGAGPTATPITFTIGTETVTIPASGGYNTNTKTITDFVNDFNAASSFAEATLVNIGGGADPDNYKIVISSIYEGTQKGSIAKTSADTWMTPNTDAATATDAKIKITGIASGATTITRTTNSFSDVIPGVTITTVATGTAGTLKISEDSATTSSKVQEFIDQFNEIVTFISENNLISRQETSTTIENIFAPLASSRTDDSALAAVKSVLSSTTASSGVAIRIFSDLGITTERDGTLKFDTTKFASAVAKEPSSVSSILQSFADTVGNTGGTIDIYTRFNGMFDMVTNGNKSQITNLNSRIADAERSIERQADDMRARFARLESLMGKLQQQQQSLTSALSGLG
jgi:flagellar hook-associated protein 2